MTIQTTYSQARASLATLWDKVTNDREIVIIRRRGAEDVAMLAADELAGLVETVYLLESPKNAERLLQALGRSLRGEGEPQTIAELKADVGFDEIE